MMAGGYILMILNKHLLILGNKKPLVLQAILDCIGTLATPQIRNVAVRFAHITKQLF